MLHTSEIMRSTRIAENFAQSMNEAMQLCDLECDSIAPTLCPFNKSRHLQTGSELQVPYENTWSCYLGGKLHCGRCGTCIERREAFYLAQIEDPTTYMPNAPSIEQMLETNWKLIED